MNRLVALAVAATISLGACGDNKPTTVAAAPELQTTPTQSTPPAVEAPPVALPQLPAVNASDAAVHPGAAEKPTPVGTAIDSAATDPKGTLTKEEESKSMPEALHGNNHSSTSLDSSAQR